MEIFYVFNWEVTMLQNRVNELNSGILEIEGHKVNVLGFTREEMVLAYLNEGLKCWSSHGLYELQDLDFHNIKSGALIVVHKDGQEIGRYQYKPVHQDTIKTRDDKGKPVSVTYKIRKSSYNNNYHFLTDKTSLLFESKQKLDYFLADKFEIEWEE